MPLPVDTTYYEAVFLPYLGAINTRATVLLNGF